MDAMPEQLPLFPAEKRCCHCKVTKPLTEFGCSRHERDGLNRQCKECVRAGSRASYDRAHQRIHPYFSRLEDRTEREALRRAGCKRCSGCGATKALAEFGRFVRSSDGLASCCRECERQRQRAAYQGQPERFRAMARDYYWRDPEKYRARKRDYGALQPDLIRLRNSMQYIKHHAKRLAYARQYRLANATSVAARQRTWRTRNLVKIRAKNEGRRARKRAAPGRWNDQDIALMCDAQRGRCAYCQTALVEPYHVEHMTPLARGGSNWPWNLCLACSRCNSRKHTLCAGAFLAQLIKERRATARGQLAV